MVIFPKVLDYSGTFVVNPLSMIAVIFKSWRYDANRKELKTLPAKQLLAWKILRSQDAR